MYVEYMEAYMHMQKNISKFISLILVFMCTFFTFSSVNSLTIRHNELTMQDPTPNGGGGYLRKNQKKACPKVLLMRKQKN